MKLIIPCVIVLTLASITSCTKKEKAVVDVKSSLIMREYPNRGAAQVTVLPDGVVVDIVEGTGPTDTIDGMKANWTKVEFNGYQGWVFGGYLIKEGTTNNKQSSPDEIIIDVPTKWEMITNAGFGYTLTFDNVKRTFSLSYYSEGTSLGSPRIEGSFTASNDSITLKLAKMEITYSSKSPANYASASTKDRLTGDEIQKFMIEHDEEGYPIKHVLIVSNIKTLTSNISEQHYDDLKTHAFQIIE